MLIYLDESGDLGWKFDAPYRQGGSSRFLTISSLVVTPDKKHLPKRMVRKLYDKFKWPSQDEKKWSQMSLDERVYFSTQIKSLIEKHSPDIRLMSITVKKQNVQEHIRRDPNKLYNFMINTMLLNEMARHEAVTLVPDPRSVKVKSGNSLHDYLQTQLWFEKQVKTRLTTTPCESASSLNIQAADMLAGLVQAHFEDGNSDPWHIIRNDISYKTLFF